MSSYNDTYATEIADLKSKINMDLVKEVFQLYNDLFLNKATAFSVALGITQSNLEGRKIFEEKGGQLFDHVKQILRREPEMILKSDYIYRKIRPEEYLSHMAAFPRAFLEKPNIAVEFKSAFIEGMRVFN